MDATSSGFQQNFSISPDKLLVDGEVIVLVDDDPYIRAPIKIYFEDNGLTVVEADSGQAFQDILNSKKVALVVLEVAPAVVRSVPADSLHALLLFGTHHAFWPGLFE